MRSEAGFDDKENPIMGEAEEEKPHCGMFISVSGRDTRKCQIAKCLTVENKRCSF